MTRTELEHIIRAACVVADDTEVIVIGSQSILGQFPAAPDELLVSMEADVYPKNHPDRSDLIDGALGELSMFHSTFGYYADGVGESTATLPAGWRDRLVPIRNRNTLDHTGWCLEVHDLLLSKYVAGREKDGRFTRGAARHGMANRAVLLERLASMELTDGVRDRVRVHIDRDYGGPV